MASITTIHAPHTVRPGQSFAVHVLDENGGPIGSPADMVIDINGLTGGRQFLQFAAVGRYPLLVTARSLDGQALKSLTAEVEVAGRSVTLDTEHGKAIALLNITHDAEVPYRFMFSVGTELHEGHRDFEIAAPVSSDRRYHWMIGDDGERIVTRVPWLHYDALWDMDHSRRVSNITVSCIVTPEDLELKRTLSLTSVPNLMLERGFVVPMVRNNQGADVGEGMFTCNVYVHNVGNDAISIDARSVSGILLDDDAPPVGVFEALGERLIIDPQAIGVVIVSLRAGVDIPWVATGVTIRFAGTSASGLPARFVATFDLPLRPRPLPQRLEIPEPAHWPWDDIREDLAAIDDRQERFAIDPVTGTVLTNVPSGAGDSDHITETADAVGQAVRAPFEQEVLPQGVPGAALVLAAAIQGNNANTIMSGDPCLDRMPQVGPVAEGEICDPDNIAEGDMATAVSGHFACTLSDKSICVQRPARWLNAHKGDVVISPSDQWSLVADVLASVTPPQPFSHSGIMTRNYDEITHSTASEDWLLDHKSDSFSADGSDGLQPEALRYLWPGVVTQSVEASIEGEPWIAPDNGKSYEISSFSPASVSATGFSYIPAMVIMPDPVLEAETPTVRSNLRQVANGIRAYSGSSGNDGAPARNSKSHYRFYCFTDPRISETEIVPAGHGWASGGFPSVCSVLIWKEMRKLGLHMESTNAVVTLSDIEQADRLAGAKIASGTLDGLYHYTAADRQKAARVLFDKIHSHVYQQAGWFGEGLTDASDDTGNQIVNTFSSDDVNGKDSIAWQTTPASDAVSPANMLWWDGPDKGGVYGFAAPAAYRPSKPEHYRLSTWRHYESNGVVHGVVTRPGGAPVPHASVQIVDGLMGGTDATGAYSIPNVPYVSTGSEYSLTAAIVVDGDLYTANHTVKVNSPSVVADFVLDAPPTSHRLVKVVAALVGGDDEDWPDDDESYGRTDPPIEVELTRDAPSQIIGSGRDPKFRWGGEVRAEHFVELVLLPGASVAVSLKGWLYEGTSESTDDLDAEGSLVRKVVGPNATETMKLRMWNQDDDEPDTFSDLTLTITNDPYP